MEANLKQFIQVLQVYINFRLVYMIAHGLQHYIIMIGTNKEVFQ